MQIGDPLRTVIVEPLELPVEEPTTEPRPEQRTRRTLYLSRCRPRRENSRSHFADRRPPRLAVGWHRAEVAQRQAVVSASATRGEMRGRKRA